MTPENVVLLGGAFALSVFGQGVLAVAYILSCFVGGLTLSERVYAFLLFSVATVFGKIFGLLK